MYSIYIYIYIYVYSYTYIIQTHISLYIVFTQGQTNRQQSQHTTVSKQVRWFSRPGLVNQGFRYRYRLCPQTLHYLLEFSKLVVCSNKQFMKPASSVH